MEVGESQGQEHEATCPHSGSRDEWVPVFCPFLILFRLGPPTHETMQHNVGLPLQLTQSRNLITDTERLMFVVIL